MKDDKPTSREPEILVEVDEPPAGAAPTAPVEQAAPAPPAPSAEERVATLEKEKQETYDRLLRTAADLDNARKRARKDVEDARVRAREEVLREVLPVVDNLERALGAAGGSAEALVEGVRLVLRQVTASLDRLQVKAFDSAGQPFDPARHEAIAQIEAADRPPGTVHTEMLKGYMMGERLLRPALVAVAKAPAAPPAPVPAPAAGDVADAGEGAGAQDGGAPAPSVDGAPQGE